jgi:hypothetical protein
MTRTTNLHDESLRARLERLMGGMREIDDVAKLYFGKRQASYGRASFRELADFAAHPDLRNRGPVTDRIRDMRTTFKPLFDRAMTDVVSLADVFARAESNFRMATDEQIARLSGGRRRKEVQLVLTAALEKMRNPAALPLTEGEKGIVISFGDRLIWNPALLGQQVFDDFKFVMVKNGLLKAAESERLNPLRSLVILHAISVMHGVAFDLGDGMKGELQAGFDNRLGCLEVTANLSLSGYPKAVTMKVGLLWTDLHGRDHVSMDLVDHPGPWEFAIEVKGELFAPIGSIVPKVNRDDGTAVISIGGDVRSRSS